MIFRFYALKTSSIIKYHALYIPLLLCAFRVLLIENCIFQQHWERERRPKLFRGSLWTFWLCSTLWRKVRIRISRYRSFWSASHCISRRHDWWAKPEKAYFRAFEDSAKSFSQLFDNLSSKPFSISEISSRSGRERVSRVFLKSLSDKFL